MKYQALFSLKNNEKIFKTVGCCSLDWHLKGFGVTSLRRETLIEKVKAL